MAHAEREVSYEYSLDLADLLANLNASLLISTYQAGKLVVVGCRRSRLALSFHNFDRPMGIAIDQAVNKLAVAARNKTWFLRNDRRIAADGSGISPRRLLPHAIGAHDRGNPGPQMAWGGDELWIVNTLFSCLCTLHPNYSFVPRWQPRFIHALGPEDRCHLNGLAMNGGKPKYVTAMAETDSPAGWRPRKAETGCLIDFESGETVSRGFAMPHSPRVHLGHVWLLDSGAGSLVVVEPTNGKVHTVACFPGYARLAMTGNLAFVGYRRSAKRQRSAGCRSPRTASG